MAIRGAERYTIEQAALPVFQALHRFDEFLAGQVWASPLQALDQWLREGVTSQHTRQIGFDDILVRGVFEDFCDNRIGFRVALAVDQEYTWERKEIGSNRTVPLGSRASAEHRRSSDHARGEDLRLVINLGHLLQQRNRKALRSVQHDGRRT